MNSGAVQLDAADAVSALARFLPLHLAGFDQMWHGFDSDTQRQLEALKELTKRRHSTPTHEWPVVFIKQVNAVLVVREWPNGDLTAYVMPRS